jgi:hypothetical protein
LREIKLHSLCEPREIRDTQKTVIPVAADECEYLVIRRVEQLNFPPACGRITFSQRDQALEEPEHGAGIVLLCLDIVGFIVVFGINDHRQV